jgi:hypothetical protein
VRVDDGVDFRDAPAARAANGLRPLSARRRAVGPCGRVVDGLTIARIGARQRVKQPTPNPAHRPRRNHCRPSKARRRPGNPASYSQFSERGRCRW